MADPSANPSPAFRQQLTCEPVRDVRIASSSGSSYDPSIRPLCEGRRRPSPNGSRMCAQVVPSEEVDARLAHCRLEPVLVALQRLPLHINKNSPLPTVAHRQLLKCRLGNRVQRNVSSVPVFALRNRNELANEINPGPNQTVLFARPHARVQSNLKLGHVGWIVGQDHGAES